jgi:hypothetical protein
MITLTDYWMGRDRLFPVALTPQIERNAATMVDLANKLVVLAKAAGVSFETHRATGSLVSSGWRPPAFNATVANAAPNSKHMTGQAIDLYDPDGDLDDWLMSAQGQKVMTDLGLWHEHPSATKGWAHLQSLPPRSGRRTFYP